MKYVEVTNTTRGAVLGTQVGVADGWWLRLRGLLARPPLASGQGLLLDPCRAVHMMGMRYALDVGFLDPQGRVVAVYRSLRPRGRTRWHSEARFAIELPVGTLDATRTREGDSVTWSPSGAPGGD